jgi:C4-dicarboxylate-specific signal transduction histidine kinase
VSFPAQAAWVCANRVILGQVIGNLFRNAGEAIAARPQASGRIDVTVVRGVDGVTVVIADDGDGFDPAAAPMLFQRGYSTRRVKSGGLGLHWSANWVAAMGGSLRLESDGPNRGARAILTLPAA